MAYLKHSTRTPQRMQIRFAGLVEPPISGKNTSGSVCGQSARDIHSGGSGR